jgi:hypothetical protein
MRGDSMFKGKEDYGFVWKYFEKAIIWLHNHLPYRFLVRSFGADNLRSFTDVFVILYTIFSIVVANILLKSSVYFVIMLILLLYIVYRIYEIIIISVYTFFIIGYTNNEKRSERIASSRRSLLFFIFNIFEFTNLFIGLGVLWCRINDSVYFTKSYFDSFVSNFYCFITFNTDALISEMYQLRYLAFIEVIVGLMFILLIISRVLSGLKSYDALEDED